MSFIIHLPASPRAEVLAPLRLLGGLEIAEEGDALWLRFPLSQEAWFPRLAALPAASVFQLGPNHALHPHGKSLPTRHLPADLAWQSLAQWLTPQLPPTRLPAAIGTTRVPFRLQRTAESRPPNVLLTDLPRWASWALQAAAIRLKTLRFAASADGRIIILGEPLPGVGGRLYHLHQGLAFPLGFEPSLALSPSRLREFLSLQDGEFGVFDEDASFQRLNEHDFVRATRSAVRLTAERFERLSQA